MPSLDLSPGRSSAARNAARLSTPGPTTPASKEPWPRNRSWRHVRACFFLLLRPAWPALLLLPCGIGIAQPEPSAAPEQQSVRAAEACEAAVAEAVHESSGAALADIQFIASRRSLSPAGENDTAVKGEGRFSVGRGGTLRGFTYSCAFNAPSGATSGVLFGEIPAARMAAGPGAGRGAGRRWQPDLTRWSPEACETAAAAALKRKYPRVAQINFNAGSRELSGTASGLGRLQASGGLVRAPGMAVSAFSFECEFEPASGRVVELRTGSVE